MSIHPKALVSPRARIGSRTTIGAFAIIEDDTEIGDDCHIEAGAQIRAHTSLGAGCFIGSGALIGADPQFRGFDRAISSGVRIGDRNTLREYVTVHRSIHQGEATVLGNENYLMAGSHVGHDTIIANENTIANNVLLAGHVAVGSHCFLGGGSVFHQFIRIGDYVMAQGNSGFSLDLPPYVIGAGVNEVAGINSVGLRRAGVSPEVRNQIKETFRKVYFGTQTLREILDGVDESNLASQLVAFYQFLRQESKKGLCIRTSRDFKSI